MKSRFADYFLAEKGFSEAAMLHEVMLECNSFLGVGFTDFSKPLRDMRGSFAWAYYPDFPKYRPLEVGAAILKFKRIFDGHDSHLNEITISRLDAFAVQALKTPIKTFNRFVYTIHAGATNNYPPNSWFFSPWSGELQPLSEAVKAGREEELRLEASNPLK